MFHILEFSILKLL